MGVKIKYKVMGTITVYPSSTAEADLIKAFLAAKQIRSVEDDTETDTDTEILDGLRVSVDELNAILRGEKRNEQTWEDMLNEVENERLTT